MPDLLTCDDPWFRPVFLKLGPDGALYIADFYNPIIGHYQASYRDPKRDKTHGRIWRITAKGRAPVKQPNLAAIAQADLESPLVSRRPRARRLNPIHNRPW